MSESNDRDFIVLGENVRSMKDILTGIAATLYGNGTEGIKTLITRHDQVLLTHTQWMKNAQEAEDKDKRERRRFFYSIILVLFVQSITLIISSMR